MSPLKRKKLSKIRLKLDKLDNSLIKVIKNRTNLVKQVLALKDKLLKRLFSIKVLNGNFIPYVWHDCGNRCDGASFICF